MSTKQGIVIENIWFDDDMVELQIISSNGDSYFINKVYASYSTVEELIFGLDRFKDQIYGGIYDIELGAFGPEYANGAFHARLHYFDTHGRILVTIHAQSEYFNYRIKSVANEATLYFVTEPALLDNFIGQLKTLKKMVSNKAALEYILDYCPT